MQALRIDQNKAVFVISATKTVPVMDLNKEDLFVMLQHIYEDENFYELDDSSSVVSNIKNPVEEEIARQIIQRLVAFSEQVSTLKESMDSKYPSVDEESHRG